MVVKWQVGDTARTADPAERVAFILSLLANPWVLSGLAAGFAAAVCWMLALAKLDLSHAYPFISLSFVLVLLLSAMAFGEPLAWQKLAGVVLICLGVGAGSQG